MTNIVPISAVIFTKNEENNICECINSLQQFAEVVVVDSMSMDKTQDYARKLGAKVVEFNWNGQYPKKRQWSLENINFSHPWILFVDADERVSPELAIEIKNFLQMNPNNFKAGSIPIEYFFAGKKLKYGQKPRKIALLHIQSSKFPIIDDLNVEGMGELEGHYQPRIQGKVRKFKSKIVHDDVDPISSWMIRHVRYANWEAHLLLNKSVKVDVESSKGLIASIFHKFPFRPLNFFFYSYFFKLGFLDGRAGFNYAIAKSWYYWLSEVIATEKVVK